MNDKYLYIGITCFLVGTLFVALGAFGVVSHWPSVHKNLLFGVGMGLEIGGLLFVLQSKK